MSSPWAKRALKFTNQGAVALFLTFVAIAGAWTPAMMQLRARPCARPAIKMCDAPEEPPAGAPLASKDAFNLPDGYLARSLSSASTKGPSEKAPVDPELEKKRLLTQVGGVSLMAAIGIASSFGLI